MARLKRRHSKKIALLGMGLGLLGVVCLSTIGFANFNFGKEENFTADGYFTIISDDEYIDFGTPTIEHTFKNISYDGFENGATKEASITLTYNVKYIFENYLDSSLDGGKDLEIYFTFVQKNNNTNHDITPELNTCDFLEEISVNNQTYSTTVADEPTMNTGMDRSCYLGTSMDSLRMVGEADILEEITLIVTYSFDFTSIADFTNDVFFKMIEQDIQFELGLFTYIPS